MVVGVVTPALILLRGVLQFSAGDTAYLVSMALMAAAVGTFLQTAGSDRSDPACSASPDELRLPPAPHQGQRSRRAAAHVRDVARGRPRSRSSWPRS